MEFIARGGLVFAAVLGLLVVGSIRGQNTQVDSYLPVFLESAWGLKSRQTVFWSGVEFEEDSGDFPTFKKLLHVRHGISNRLLFHATSQLVRFNKGTYTAWGSSNPSFGLQYRLPLPPEGPWALQLKGEVLPSWGGMATGRTCFSPGVDLSRQFGKVGVHVNGTATAGGADGKTIGVSEVDRWRVSAGYDWRLKDASWIVMMAWIRAQPIRRKPVESTVEVGVLRRLSSFLSIGGGAATGISEKGQDYLLRFGMMYVSE